MTTEYSQTVIANRRIIAQRFHTFAIYLLLFAFLKFVSDFGLRISSFKSVKFDETKTYIKTYAFDWRPVATTDSSLTTIYNKEQ